MGETIESEEDQPDENDNCNRCLVMTWRDHDQAGATHSIHVVQVPAYWWWLVLEALRCVVDSIQYGVKYAV